jgi:hypothetical protein
MNKLIYVLLFFTTQCFSETCSNESIAQWENKVKETIKENTMERQSAGLNMTMAGSVKMLLSKNGALISQEIAQSTGFGPLDKLMLITVSTTKLPELNCNTDKNLTIIAPFNYQM